MPQDTCFSRFKLLGEITTKDPLRGRSYKLTLKESHTCFFPSIFPPVSEHRNHLSTWMGPDHSCGRESSPLQNSHEKLSWAPAHTVRLSWTLELVRCRGGLGPWLIRRWMWEPHTVLWLLLLLADCEELHELYLSCFLYHCQSPLWTGKCCFPIGSRIVPFCMHRMMTHKRHVESASMFFF